MASITAPAPFIVETRRLFGEMNGKPYQADRRQLSMVMLYGIPEKSSVDFCLNIFLNVKLEKKKI